MFHSEVFSWFLSNQTFPFWLKYIYIKDSLDLDEISPGLYTIPNDQMEKINKLNQLNMQVKEMIHGN